MPREVETAPCSKDVGAGGEVQEIFLIWTLIKAEFPYLRVNCRRHRAEEVTHRHREGTLSAGLT